MEAWDFTSIYSKLRAHRKPSTDKQLQIDPKIMLKIVIQTLYEMGYEQSAEQLERQANIEYYSKQIRQLRCLLLERDYQKAIRMIQQIWNRQSRQREQKENEQNSKKYQQAIDNLKELQCRVLINENTIQKALQLIQNNKISNRDKLCNMIIFGNSDYSLSQLQSIHDHILTLCMKQPLQPQMMNKIISTSLKMMHENSYVFSANKFDLHMFDKIDQFPPCKIDKISQNSVYSQVQFVRISDLANAICVVGYDKDIVVIQIYNYPQLQRTIIKRIPKQLTSNQRMITSLHFTKDYITLTLEHSVFVYNDKLNQIFKANFIDKILLCGRVYEDKLYSVFLGEQIYELQLKSRMQTNEQIIIYEVDSQASNLQLQYVCRKIYIGYKLREIQFHPTLNGLFYGISATENRIINYNIYNDKLIKNIYNINNNQSLPMMLTIALYQNNHNTYNNKYIILVSSQKYITIYNSQLNILSTIHGIYNDGCNVIEIGLFGSWIIIQGQKILFKKLMINNIDLDYIPNTPPTTQLCSPYCYTAINSIHVQFPIMVTIPSNKESQNYNKIIIWKSGNPQELSKHQEIIQDNQDSFIQYNTHSSSSQVDSDQAMIL